MPFFFGILKSVSAVGWGDLFQWSWWWGQGMLTGALGLFQICVASSQFHYAVLSIS
jgi:hypothetical protein